MNRLSAVTVVGLIALSCSDSLTGSDTDGGASIGFGREDLWQADGKISGKTQEGSTQNLENCGDKDGDGFGIGCLAGPDCDDTNPKLNVYCPPCKYGIYEGCTCANPGAVVTCYPADPVTLNVGTCKAGEQRCEDGFWSACEGFVGPVPEVCDGQDNDCDGATDEGVLSPCGNCDQMCTHIGAGPDEVDPFELNDTNSSGVAENVDGYIVLDSTSVNMEFIWIANSGENTVSKLDTSTGKETGRYHLCSDPSRTSVDLYGDVWVGCRGDGGVAKVHVTELLCKDENGNGVIDTSRDEDGNGVINGSEILAKGQDECVAFIVNPGGSCQRALGVDKDNYAWVGEWYSKVLRRLHPEDGHTVQEIGIPANPYGMVIDKNGVIWVSGRGGNLLVRVDPQSGEVNSYSAPGDFSPYGITLDNKGRVWVANYASLNVAWRYDPQTGNWANAPTHSHPRGLVGSMDGFVYVANDSASEVAVIHADSLTTQGYVTLGGGRFPVGMAIDFDGFVWAVNQSASSASKIDPEKMVVIGEYPTGSNPYTYSDMTGYLLHTFTNPTGFYRHLFGSSGVRFHWTSLIVDAYTPSGTSIKVRVRAAVTQEQLESTPWSGYFGPFPPEQFPLNLIPLNLEGHYLEVEVSLYSSKNGDTPIVKAIYVQFDKGEGS